MTSLIHIDQDRAANFLTKLSKVYRYVLENKDKNIVTLSEEVEWATSYVHLLKDRFGDNIEVVIDIEAEFMDRQVLPLCLQILFENAIKHNIITSQNPLKIKVNAIENCLCVSNNLQTKNIIEDSTKFGLENIRKRYSYFTDELIFVSDKNGMFKVCLPYIST